MSCVLLVDDHAATRQALALLLARDPGLRGLEVAEAGSLAEARRCLLAAPPDLAVVDLGLPDGDGADLLAELRGVRPGCGLLALAATQAETDRAAAAPGVLVLCKTSSLEAVLGAIRALAVGDRVPAP